MADAAYTLVAVGHPGVTEKWYKVDVAIAVENMVLAARSLGYGTCWIGAFAPDKVKALCGVPSESEVVVCLALGVPDEAPAARSRKAWEEVFSANGYGEPLEL
jgi:nitroreductase